MWLEGLTLKQWEDKYDHTEEIEYFHYCYHEWVAENFKPGDKCIAIIEYKSGLGECLMYSCLLRDGKYLDVRGDTENFDDVIDGLDYDEFNVETYDTLEKFKARMREFNLF
jgi:hypothetical protein